MQEWEVVSAELATHIADIGQRLWRERNRAFNYVALVFERARLREALRGFGERREGELVELRGMRGLGRWDRVADLRDGWVL